MVAAGLLGACAGQPSGTPVTVRMDAPGAWTATPADSLVEVKVKDARASRGGTRQAAFGVDMGDIVFDPPEARIVKVRLEQALNRLLKQKGVTQRQTVECDLKEFTAGTDTTPVYWGVVGRISVVLRDNGRELPLSSSATERTYVWPGETIIRKVTEESMRLLLDQLDKKSGELLG